MTPDRTNRAYRIATVCLGNICRSPMAAVVLTEKITAAGLADRVQVVSAGTGDWHVGAAMDRRAAETLTTHGYDATGHRARQADPDWLGECDLVLAMDADNYRTLADITAGAGVELQGRLRMFRDFDPALAALTPSGRAGDVGDSRNVPDPYYGQREGFSTVLTIVERTAQAIVDGLVASAGAATSGDRGHGVD